VGATTKILPIWARPFPSIGPQNDQELRLAFVEQVSCGLLGIVFYRLDLEQNVEDFFGHSQKAAPLLGSVGTRRSANFLAPALLG